MTDGERKEHAEIVRALRNESGTVKRSTLLAAAKAIETMEQEIDFGAEMQRELINGMSDEEIGRTVNAVMKRWR